jgi:hypothetical protein
MVRFNYRVVDFTSQSTSNLMSQTYVGILVMALSVFLPKLGVTIDNDALTNAISVVSTVAGALWAARSRYRLGGVNILGLRV